MSPDPGHTDHVSEGQGSTFRLSPKFFRGVVGGWVRRQFAEDWLEDCRHEAASDGVGAKRREIVFAVCFAESYLVEWALTEVLDNDVDRLLTHFRPAGPRRSGIRKWLTTWCRRAERGGIRRVGIRRRWKAVTRSLYKDKLIPNRPQTGDQHSEQWARLLRYRDGLVHAEASWPELPEQPADEGPMPNKDALVEIENGWALRVAVEQAQRLHRAAGTKPPDWLHV